MSQRIVLPKLYLTSQSPRREQILSSLGLSFGIIKPQIEENETANDKTVQAVTLDNALRKAQAGAKQISEPDAVAIGADTLVVLGERVLTKPRDVNDAIQILSALSGNSHRVVTGMAFVSKKFGNHSFQDWSTVHFRKFSDDEIRSYVATREPHDKAGAYAIQGLGALFIDRIEGSYTNVMGLPIEAFLKELAVFTKTSVFDWFA